MSPSFLSALIGACLRSLVVQPAPEKTAFKAMHVAHCAFSLGAGGAERQLATTVRGLSGHGYEQSILCSSLANGSDRHYMNELQDIPLRFFDISSIKRDLSSALPRSRVFIPPGAFRQGVYAYMQALGNIRPGIVHVWSDNIQAAFAAAMLGVPRILVSWRNLAPPDCLREAAFLKQRLRNIFLYHAYRELARHPAVRFANNSLAGGKSYARWLGLEPARIALLHNGVNENRWRKPDAAASPAWRKSMGIAPETPLVVGMMRFSEQKRPMLWLESARSALRKKPLFFILYGDGPMRPQMERYIAREGLRANIILPGRTDDAAKALGFADLFFLSSFHEGLPNVLLEAQLLGVPVLATDAGGTSEALLPGRSGILMPLDTRPEMIAEEITRIIDDRNWRERASASAKEFVTGRFGAARMVDETRLLYTN